MSSASEGLAKKRKIQQASKNAIQETSVVSYIATPNRDSGSVGAAGRDANPFRCEKVVLSNVNPARPIKADPLAEVCRQDDPGRMSQPLRKFLFQRSQLGERARSVRTNRLLRG